MPWVRGCEAHNRLPEDQRRTCRFSVNANDEEEAAIRAAAARAGKKPGSWLREVALVAAQEGRAEP